MPSRFPLPPFPSLYNGRRNAGLFLGQGTGRYVSGDEPARRRRTLVLNAASQLKNPSFLVQSVEIDLGARSGQQSDSHLLR